MAELVDEKQRVRRVGGGLTGGTREEEQDAVLKRERVLETGIFKL